MDLPAIAEVRLGGLIAGRRVAWAPGPVPLLAVEALVSAMVVVAKQPEGARLPRLALALGVLAVAAGLGAVPLLV